MGQLVIKREKAMIGFAVKMDCYVDSQLVCQLKNDEEFTITVEGESAIFKCQLGKMNPVSDSYLIDTTIYPSLTVIVKQNSIKPTVKFVNALGEALNIEVSEAQSKLHAKANTSFFKTGFTPTMKVGNYFGINEDTREWVVGKGIIPNFIHSPVYHYEDIISFELLEDGTSVASGGLGSAAVGGLLFGGVGAIVGGVTGGKKARKKCTSLMIKITVKNMSSPVEYIKLISTTTDKGSFVYKTAFENAQRIISMLELISSQLSIETSQCTPADITSTPSAADEIRKFKSLMDDGILTAEEFEAKKKELLGLQNSF